MAKKKSIFSKFRLVYRPSTPILKWVVLTMVVFCIVALIFLGAAIDRAEREKEDNRHQAEALENENAKLQQSLDELGTVQGVINVARDELGYEDTDAIIFEPVATTEAQ